MHATTPVMWTAAVDYIRLTHREGEGCDTAELAYQAAVSRVGRVTEGDTALPRPWGWMGYYGHSLGSVAAGRGSAGALLQCSGAAAATVFDMALPWTGCPRLDVQVTCWYEHDWAGTAAALSELAVSANARRVGRPAKVRLVNGFGEGDTLYVGARGKASKFLRVYDKWRESGRDDLWRYAWRYEVELTDGHARYAVRSLESTGQSEHTAAALVASYFEERGLSLPVCPEAARVPPSVMKKDPSSTYRRLMWLHSQVKPAIDRMIADGVSSDEIRAVLGLAEGPQRR